MVKGVNLGQIGHSDEGFNRLYFVIEYWASCGTGCVNPGEARISPKSRGVQAPK
jgi:hypothetical protein